MIKLKDNEKVLITVRKHWIVFAMETLAIIFCALMPLFLAIILLAISEPIQSTKLFYIISFLYSLWIIFMWLWFFLSWTDYYLDALIITDQQIIYIDQRGLFSRETSSFDINKIQDVTVDVHGFFATIFDFGDLHIQTASEQRKFIIHNATDPHKAKEIILKNSDNL